MKNIRKLIISVKKFFQLMKMQLTKSMMNVSIYSSVGLIYLSFTREFVIILDSNNGDHSSKQTTTQWEYFNGN